jgi:PAB-dependent poly(A)-specific ribonuclease subunit 3
VLGGGHHPNPNIFEICKMLTGQLIGQLDQTYAHVDAVENEMMRQFNCGRMLRILLKTNLVNARPELGMDTRWSETGDRYVLSLFNHYLFHQHGMQGEPVVDFGHIIESLNKLDAGSMEKILLTSRDGKSIIVASFFEIRRCIHEAFLELIRSGTGPGVPAEAVNLRMQQQQRMMMEAQMQQMYGGGAGGMGGGGMGMDMGQQQQQQYGGGQQQQMYGAQQQGGYGVAAQQQQQQMYGAQQQQPQQMYAGYGGAGHSSAASFMQAH